MKYPSRIFAVIFQNRVAKIRCSMRDANKAARAIRYENHISRADRERVIVILYTPTKGESLETLGDTK